MPVLPYLAAGTAAAGLAGSFLSPKAKRPDIGGELANIQSLFEQMRAQATANINREAAQGRTQAASNLATRGTYRSGVAQNAFNALEGERLNAIASSDAQLAGQEAGMRAGLLKTLLGLNAEADQQGSAANAARFGGLTAIGSNLLLANLLRGGAGGSGIRTGGAPTTASNNYVQALPGRNYIAEALFGIPGVS